MKEVEEDAMLWGRGRVPVEPVPQVGSGFTCPVDRISKKIGAARSDNFAMKAPSGVSGSSPSKTCIHAVSFARIALNGKRGIDATKIDYPTIIGPHRVLQYSA